MLSTSALERERRRALDAVGGVLGIESWPAVPLAWNRRLRRAGRALVSGYGIAGPGGSGPGGRPRDARIELSPAYFAVYPEDLFGILVHEAVHVGLAVVGRPNGHGPEFRAACARAGGLQHGRPMPGRVYRYRCPVCGIVLERRRRASDDRWCAACVERSVARHEPAYAPERALLLVGTRFEGPARRGPASPGAPGTPEPGTLPLRYLGAAAPVDPASPGVQGRGFRGEA